MNARTVFTPEQVEINSILTSMVQELTEEQLARYHEVQDAIFDQELDDQHQMELAYAELELDQLRSENANLRFLLRSNPSDGIRARMSEIDARIPIAYERYAQLNGWLPETDEEIAAERAMENRAFNDSYYC